MSYRRASYPHVRRALAAPLCVVLLLGACGSGGSDADTTRASAELLTEDELSAALLTVDDLPADLDALVEVDPYADDSEIEVTGAETCQDLMNGTFGAQPDVEVESEFEDPKTLTTAHAYLEGHQDGFPTFEEEYKRIVEDCAEFSASDDEGVEMDFTVTGEGSIPLGDQGFSLLIEASYDGAKVAEAHERVVLVGNYLVTVDYYLFEPGDASVVDELTETAIAKLKDTLDDVNPGPRWSR